MAKPRSYSLNGLYFTNHALERAIERGLKPSDIWAVWHNPTGSRYASSKGAFIYWRDYGDLRIEVVARKKDKKWVVISVWSRRNYNKKRVSFFSLLFQKIKKAFLAF